MSSLPQLLPSWQPEVCSLYLWFCFKDLFICYNLVSTYKWHHMIFVFLTSLSMMISSCIHVAANGIHLFFLMAELCSIVYMYSSFFIHPSVGHLGCLQVLAIVNSAAVNTEVHVSFWITVLCPRMGLLDHVVVLFLAFWGPSILLSIIAALTCIATNSGGGFLFPAFIICRLFNDGHSDRCEVTVGSICISLSWPSSHMPIGHLHVFWRNIYLGLLPIFG